MNFGGEWNSVQWTSCLILMPCLNLSLLILLAGFNHFSVFTTPLFNCRDTRLNFTTRNRPSRTRTSYYLNKLHYTDSTSGLFSDGYQSVSWKKNKLDSRCGTFSEKLKLKSCYYKALINFTWCKKSFRRRRRRRRRRKKRAESSIGK